eukprot:scaffold112802_cov15-Tisochrysis_lutea.AAC.2
MAMTLWLGAEEHVRGWQGASTANRLAAHERCLGLSQGGHVPVHVQLVGLFRLDAARAVLWSQHAVFSA